jgi:hypothetical protein
MRHITHWSPFAALLPVLALGLGAARGGDKKGEEIELD